MTSETPLSKIIFGQLWPDIERNLAGKVRHIPDSIFRMVEQIRADVDKYGSITPGQVETLSCLTGQNLSALIARPDN